MAPARSTARYLLFVVLLFAAVSCDQGTKLWARDALAAGSITVIPGFLELRLAQNPDAAFSLLRGVPGASAVVTVVGVALVAGMFVWLRRTVLRGGRLAVAALALIAGGAIGNLADRVLFGSVTDFVAWHAGAWRWPVFNVADALLVAGIPLMLLAPARGMKSDPCRAGHRASSPR